MMFPANDIKRIAVFRALQLGDLLCSVPAFRALRNCYPSAHIALIGMPWMKALVERFPNYFDEFIWFPGYPGLPEQQVDTRRTIGFLQQMNDRQFDLTLQMQGNGSVINPMIELFGAKNTAGYYQAADYFPGPGFVRYPEGISEIHRHLLLMQHLNIPACGDQLEFPLLPRDVDDLAKASIALDGSKYICVHPGSRGLWRQWPTTHFASVADQVNEMGYRVVITGTTEEIPIVHEVVRNMVSEPVVAAGKTNLGAMAALLDGAAGLISNCTGVSHIAAAMKVKSVVISMDGEPERWAPLNTDLHITIDWTKTKDLDSVRQAVRHLFATSP